jgi:hypothetical protein
MVNAKYTIPALIVVFGGGLAYWVISNRDTTPVGLTITKTVENSQPIGNKGEDEYGIGLVEGTFRESESTLPISSEGENRPLLVVSKNGETIDAKVVNKPEPESVELVELMLEVAQKYDLDSKEDYEQIVADLKQQEEGTQEAESIFGPMMTLQSHFVW